jgi:hypothetical protein
VPYIRVQVCIIFLHGVTIYSLDINCENQRDPTSMISAESNPSYFDFQVVHEDPYDLSKKTMYLLMLKYMYAHYRGK